MKFITSRMHAISDLGVAAVLILSPALFGYRGTAASVAVTIGILLVILELITDNGFSLVGWISMHLHIMTDYLAGIIVLLSPWIWGFHDSTRGWLPMVIVGAAILGNAMMTIESPARGGRHHGAHA